MRATRGLLVPPEHGTWAELLFPLLCALALGVPTRTSWAIAVAAFGGFLATEGVQVLTGARGGRAAREQRGAAIRSLGVFASTCAIAGAAGFLASTRDVRVALALAAVLALVLAMAVLAGRIKSGGGEIAAAVALPAWSVPVAMSAGVSVALALAVWSVWSASFVGATLAVRTVIARSTRRPSAASRQGALGVAMVTLASIAVLAARGTLPGAIAVGFIPTACVIGFVACAAIPARRLRAVGWTFVAASAVLFVALVMAG